MEFTKTQDLAGDSFSNIEMTNALILLKYIICHVIVDVWIKYADKK
jgi:hypothetical protein